MCYCGCQFEAYPHGPNEGCVCRRPKWIDKCPDEYDEDEDENEEYYDPEEEWACQEYDRMKEEKAMHRDD